MDKRSYYLRKIAQTGMRRRLVFGAQGISWTKDPLSPTMNRVKHIFMEWITMRQYWDNGKGTEELALKADASKEEINEFIWKATGKRFYTLRKELRIEDAMEILLVEEDMTAAAVGRMLGFNDKSDFRKQFQEAVGCTPSEWRSNAKVRNRCRRPCRISNLMNNRSLKRTCTDRAR